MSPKTAPTRPERARPALPTRRSHNGCPILGCSGGDTFLPDLSSDPHPYRVALIGEALGETEAEQGGPFKGKAGFKLTRLIEWAGLERSKFDIYNVVWCRPPNNQLEGMPYEDAAVEWWKPYWRPLLSRADVVVPMGNVPMAAFTGRKGILKARGYFTTPDPNRLLGDIRLLPTVHPSFIQRGQSKYSAAFIHDLQKAVAVAQGGMQFEAKDYLLDPTPADAYQWAKQYRVCLDKWADMGGDPIRLAYDIETPGKGEDESESDEDDPTYFIWRIGFSYSGLSALSIPWTGPYLPAIKLILESSGEKVVWNAGFDNPRIRHNGVNINGLIHDGMIAWHILHSDLPKGLGFVATFTCPFQPAWKHLSTKSPAFYNATDADVELRSFLSIERELVETGLWGVYQRDVLDLEPILVHMSREGMPIDPLIREDKANQLATRQASCLAEMIAAVPLVARKIEHIYVNTPKDLTGLLTRPSTREGTECSGCGILNPKRDHFKSYVRKVNPCAGCEASPRTYPVEEYYRLGEFTPSRVQLIRYQQALSRPVPTAWDKKTQTRKPSMDSKAITKLMIKYPLDKLYPLVLTYRELDKVAGTYIGRPE